MSTTEATDAQSAGSTTIKVDYELIRRAAQELERVQKELTDAPQDRPLRAFYVGRTVEAIDICTDSMFNVVNDLSAFLDNKQAQQAIEDWHRPVEPLHSVPADRVAAQDADR